MAKIGKLYICGTPIGNLKDITLRALEILKQVDLIAAEDTRRTSKLLNKYEISTSLTSYHEHNEREKSEELINKINRGIEIALVSDAGMPGISDPGSILIKQAIKNGIEIIPVPGPTALISALVVSGISMDKFIFLGFIPRKGEDRKKVLNQIKKSSITTILYESPYRLKNTLTQLDKKIKTDRKIAVLREITKIHEEKIYGNITEVLQKLKQQEIKGEIVIVIEGREIKKIEGKPWKDMDILEHVELFIKNGYTKKEAIKKVAKARNIPKRKVYKKAIAIDARIENKK